MSDGTTAPRKSRLRTRAALVLASLAAGLVLAEVGLRVALAARGTPYAAAKAREYLAEIESRNAQALPLPGRAASVQGGNPRVSSLQHPYVGWETNFAAGNLTNDLQRFSKPAPDRVRVLVLGGSVAGIFHDLGLPVVERLLEGDPALRGRRFEFVLYARGAYKQPQLLQYLCFLFSLGVVPDVVLLVDGFNEVAIGSANYAAGFHPSWPSEVQWLPLVTSALADPELLRDRVDLQVLQDRLVESSRSAAGSSLLASAIYGELAIQRVRGLEARFRELSQAYSEAIGGLAPPELRGPALPRTPGAGVVFTVRHWMECSRTMKTLCDSRGVRFLHVLQPTLHDPGAKPMTPEEVEKGAAQEAWIFGVEKGYPLLRKAGATLAAEGVAFVDASRVFEDVRETLYYDACHFAERGNEILAELVAPALAALLAEGR